MSGLLHKIKTMIRYAVVTLDGDDLGAFPVQQVGYLKKVGDCVMFFPYGMHANAAAEDEPLVAMFSIEGKEENRFGIPGTPKSRPKLLPGEVAFYHPSSGARIKFTAAGEIEIDTTLSGGAIKVISPTTVDIDTPLVTMTGALTVDGEITFKNKLTQVANFEVGFGVFVTSDGTNISNNHKHSGVTSGGSNTGDPI